MRINSEDEDEESQYCPELDDHIEIIQRLINKGANIDAQDISGDTILH